jgi:hypothetical protein
MGGSDAAEVYEALITNGAQDLSGPARPIA